MPFETIPIYDTPPSRHQLARWSRQLEGGVAAFVATRSRAYRDLDLKDRELDDEAWLNLIEAQPRLLRRPILTDGETTVVGFKQAQYQALLA